jgi:hypothetical protein
MGKPPVLSAAKYHAMSGWKKVLSIGVRYSENASMVKVN